MMMRHLISAIALTTSAAQAAPPHWIASWGTAQLPLDAKDRILAPNSGGVTLRQTVRVSAGGQTARLRLSNVFGDAPLAIGGVRLNGVTLTFSRRANAEIPSGAELYTDPAAVALPPGGDATIDIYLPAPPDRQTGHPGARATTLIAPGDQSGAALLKNAQPVTRWYAIADVEVRSSPAVSTIAIIGDSITDGYGVKPDSNGRWTDFFAARLRASTALSGWGVVNAGIGGNRVTLDGLGPNLLARFDRDVIARAGVRHAIVLEGINDLGTLTREHVATPAEHAALVRRVTAGYAELSARARAHGITLIGGTILPFASNAYYHPGPASEADRQQINAFIRTSGVFDAVIDFDAAMRDPAQPDRLNPAYDSGDGLHPSAAGYRAMAEAVPLTLFGRPARALAPARPMIAVTFDDIPVHGPLPPGETRAYIVGRIAKTLKAAAVPAYGFLNAGFAKTPDDRAAIAAWRASFPLGNHGFTHQMLSKLDVDSFAKEVTANEPALGDAPRWFRYPFLDEGQDAARRDAARGVLAARGYRVAAVTMSFGDFSYNEPYARCLANRDVKSIAALEARWLSAARTEAINARARMRTLYGREVPLVLLMHVGAFDARMLSRTIALYRSLGFTFTTLAMAQSDPAYSTANDLRIEDTSPNPSLLMTDIGVKGPVPTTGPPLESICR